MTLVHYSAKPFALDATRVYEQPEAHFKPNGLWLSVEDNDDGWKQWCEGEGFNLDGLAHRTEITLTDANILHIETPQQLDEFTATYRLMGQIDWPRVVAQYDGIIIAPYIWERRLSSHTFWYYCWDCASACIWNVDILEQRMEAACPKT